METSEYSNPPISDDLTKPNWQEAYTDYLNKNDLNDYYGFYIRDINSDGIPEIVIRYDEYTNSGEILYFADNKLQTLNLRVISVWGDVGYLEETNQIVFLHWYGHTTGTFGSVEFFLYDWTSDGYIETHSVIRESGYAKYDDEGKSYVEVSYGQGYINGDEVDFNEFEIALAEMHALLEKSTWFPMTDADEVEDYSDYFIQWN